MNEYIADGEIHPINDKYNYILKFIEKEIKLIDSDETLSKFIEESIHKYTKYIFEKYPEYAFEQLKEKFISENNIIRCTEQIQFIFRPEIKSDCLIQKASLAMKFSNPAKQDKCE